MKKFTMILFLLFTFSCSNQIDKKTAIEYYEKIGTELIKVSASVKYSNNEILKLYTQVTETGSVNQDQIEMINNSLEKVVELIENAKSNISSIPEIDSKENIKKSGLILLNKFSEIEKNKVPLFIKLISARNEEDYNKAMQIVNDIVVALKSANQESRSSETKYWEEFGIDRSDLESFYRKMETEGFTDL